MLQRTSRGICLSAMMRSPSSPRRSRQLTCRPAHSGSTSCGSLRHIRCSAGACWLGFHAPPSAQLCLSQRLPPMPHVRHAHSPAAVPSPTAALAAMMLCSGAQVTQACLHHAAHAAASGALLRAGARLHIQAALPGLHDHAGLHGHLLRGLHGHVSSGLGLGEPATGTSTPRALAMSHIKDARLMMHRLPGHALHACRASEP